MLTEACVACGADVPLSDAVHMLVNPKGGEEVADGYLCRSCYEEHVQDLLPDDEQDLIDDEPDDARPPDADEGPDDVDPNVDDGTEPGDDAAPGEV